MACFVVHGPFPVSFEKRKGGRTLVFDGFWSEVSGAAELAEKRGCYVFAIRNRGLTPVYVGKATKSFKQETFNPANKHKYHNGFSNFGKGKPVLYFVVHPPQKGPVNGRQIAEVEDFLIQLGIAKNPDLQNVKGSQKPDWSIKGVVRHGAGGLTKPEKDFVSLFDIKAR